MSAGQAAGAERHEGGAGRAGAGAAGVRACVAADAGAGAWGEAGHVTVLAVVARVTPVRGGRIS